MNNNSITRTTSSFESGINKITLRFTDNILETEYQKQRISFKLFPTQVKFLFMIGIITNVILIALDAISGLAINSEYSYEYNDVLFLLLYIPVFICEFIFYKVKKLIILRGSFFTCFIYFIIIYSSSERFSDIIRYPVITAPILLWNGCMLFVHMFYVLTWLTSLVSYIIIYLEIMTIIVVKYGGHFARESTIYCIIWIVFYTILFGVFIGVTIYTYRTFEIKERANFYFEYQANREIEKWKSLLNDLPEPVILTQNGNISFCNTATQKFFGFGCGSTADKILEELIKLNPVNPSSQSFIELLKKPLVAPDKEGFIYESNLGKKHKLLVKHVIMNSISGPGITEYIFHDITTVEELEREKTQSNCFRILVGSASHEIRTPINALKGILDGLSEAHASLKETKIAEISIRRLELYVKELYIIQNIETESLKIDKELFDPTEIVHKVTGYFQYLADLKGLKLQINDCKIPGLISDKEKYEIILYHLLENSFKRTHEGIINISLEYDKESEILITTIFDSSSNPVNEQEYAFKLFSQNEDFDPSCPHDINLGLFLSNLLSSNLSGSLKFQSLPGLGTKSIFTIKNHKEIENEENVIDENPKPRSISELEQHTWRSLRILTEIAKETKESLLPTLNYRPRLNSMDCSCPKVLIVDDEPFNIFVLRKYLFGTGIRADVAINGKQAIETILKRKSSCNVCNYKVIFMDINMPVMNGIVTMKKIAELVNTRVIPDIPVIAVTAAVHTEDEQTILTYRGYGFKRLCKFFTPIS